MNDYSNTLCIYKNSSADLEVLKSTVTDIDIKRKRKIVRERRKEFEAWEFQAKRLVDKDWRRRNKTDKLKMHHNSVAARNKRVKDIMLVNFTPDVYGWFKRHTATIYRNIDDVYKSIQHQQELKQQRQEEANKKEEQRKRAFHIEFCTDPESAMLSKSSTGMKDKQRYNLSQQVKGKKKYRRKRKFDPQRDEREQHLQGSSE